MRAMYIAVVLFICFVLATMAFGQSPAPVLSWSMALEGYQIERSFDNGANFKVVAQLPPTTVTYTDTTALADAPLGTSQVCYRIVPLLFNGPGFFNDPTCIPFNPGQPIVITLDNGQPGTSIVAQSWSTSGAPNFFGINSLYSTTTSAVFRWTPNLTSVAPFHVYAWWTQHAGRTTTAPYRIKRADGSIVQVLVDQKVNGGKWNLLGTFDLGPGSYVELTGQFGQASADAIKFEETP